MEKRGPKPIAAIESLRALADTLDRGWKSDDVILATRQGKNILKDRGHQINISMYL
jgi:hypothetical protein